MFPLIEVLTVYTSGFVRTAAEWDDCVRCGIPVYAFSSQSVWAALHSVVQPARVHTNLS
jgi:hypothetical protein